MAKTKRRNKALYVAVLEVKSTSKRKLDLWLDRMPFFIGAEPITVTVKGRAAR